MAGNQHAEKRNGILLAICAIIAIIACNTPLNTYYQQILNTIMIIQVGDYKLAKPTVMWINEGLMAIFFLAVTLEIKHEMFFGSLNTNSKRALPLWGAIGGMIVPAAIYLYLCQGTPDILDGWAIPTATDIVFALSLLSIVYENCPQSVRSFLLALAVFDDIGAIVIIAVYYTSEVATTSLVLMPLLSLLLLVLNRKKVQSISFYMFIGVLLWVIVLKSGVHATLAGIAVGLALPSGNTSGKKPLAEKVEKKLYPWVNYFILPLFAFANAGVSFSGISTEKLFHIMPIAIICGLVFGKQIGITLFSYLAVKLRIAELPKSFKWHDVYGISILCGVGFTMSLFIGALAFENNTNHYSVLVRLGVIFGSLISAILAALYFKILHSNKD